MKLVAGATVAVLLTGGFIAMALLVATDDDAPRCGRTLAGEAAAVIDDLTAGPYLLSGGGACSFWLALDDGDVVAYKVAQPSGCTLNVRRNAFECGGQPADIAALAQYPVSIVTRDGLDSYVVDLGPQPQTPVTTG